MKFSFLTVLVLLAALPSFASGVNLVECGSVNSDDTLTIRQDSGGQLVALYSMLDHGTLAYKVEQTQQDPDKAGAGHDYVGAEVSLHINTDGPANAQGFYSTLTIRSIVKNEAFRCSLLD
jgi:hypothetical protein